MSTGTLREQIDEIVPRCGERDCDTCDERHIKLYELVQSLIATDKAQAVQQHTSKVNRLEVIDEAGRAYVRGSIYGSPVSVKLSYQDDGRTLKVFVKELQTPVRGGK